MDHAPLSRRFPTLSKSLWHIETRADRNLTTVAKLANRGSGLLKLADVDLKISVENAATVALAKKLNLVA